MRPWGPREQDFSFVSINQAIKTLRGIKAAVLHRRALSVPLDAPQVGPGKL